MVSASGRTTFLLIRWTLGEDSRNNHRNSWDTWGRSKDIRSIAIATKFREFCTNVEYLLRLRLSAQV